LGSAVKESESVQVTYKVCLSSETWSNHSIEPEIEYIMKKYVA